MPFPGSFIQAVLAATALVATIATGAKIAGAGGLASPTAAPSDRITLPDIRREFKSASGRFAFVVSTQDDWKSLRGTGELISIAGSVRTLLWSHALPQQFGPRFVLVSDLGTVLMLDEWINVRSPFAVLVVDRNNRTVRQHGADAVVLSVQVPEKDVVRMAKYGWWISAPPRLNSAGDGARVETAGKILTIRLSDGQLAVD